MVLDKLIQAGFAVKCEKVHIGKTNVPYLGFNVGRDGTKPRDEKTKAILDLAYEDIRTGGSSAAARYSGMIGFYHRFIPNLHSVLAPFHACKAKNAPVADLMMSLQMRAAFEYSKHALAAVTALARPDYSKIFYIDVDAASSSGAGAVLSQRDDENDPDSHRPLAFWSRRYNDEEKRYGVRDQECLGLCESVTNWRHMVNGARVIVRTDHRSLQWLMSSTPKPGSRVSGWTMKLQPFDMEIQYVPGEQNIVADFKSRQPGKTAVPSESTERAPIEDRVDEALDTATTYRDAHPLVPPLARPASLLDAALAELTAASASRPDGGTVPTNSKRGENSGANGGIECIFSAIVECTGSTPADDDTCAVAAATAEDPPLELATCTPTSRPTRTRAERAAVAFLSKTADGSLAVLVERQLEFASLPSVPLNYNPDGTGANAPRALNFRAQLSRRLAYTYAGEALLQQLSSRTTVACKRRGPTRGTHFFVGHGQVEPTPLFSGTARFEVINESLMARLGEEDASFLNLLSWVSKGSKPIMMPWNLDKARAVLTRLPTITPAVSAAHVGTDGQGPTSSEHAIARATCSVDSGGLVKVSLAAVYSAQTYVLQERERLRAALGASDVNEAHAFALVAEFETKDEMDAVVTEQESLADDPQSERPALLNTPDSFRTASKRLRNRLEAHPELSMAVDLEGHRLGMYGKTSLIQVAVDSAMPDDKQLVYVFDTLACGDCLRDPDSDLRALLESPTVLKVLHCYYGDAAALFHEFGIVLKYVLDTGLGDCFARGQATHKVRRLDRVVTHYLGESACMSLKGQIDHEQGLWLRRPLTRRLFVYAYEDVIYCNRLATVMRAQLVKMGLWELTLALSLQRAPPAALSPQHVLYTPPLRVAVALVDEADRVLCRRDGNLLSLPSGPATGFNLKNCAQQMWRQVMGAVPKAHALRSVISNRMKKGVRIGNTMLFQCNVSSVVDCLPALTAALPDSSSVGLCTKPVFMPDSPCSGCVPEQAILFQHLHATAAGRDAEACAIVPVFSAHTPTSLRVRTACTVSPTGRVSLTLFTSVSATPSATVYAAAAAATAEPLRVAAIVHDGEKAFMLRTPQRTFALPTAPVEDDTTSSVSAAKALDLFAGSALRKRPSATIGGPSLQLMPETAKHLNAALDASVSVGVFGNVEYVSCRLPPHFLTTFASSFHAARRPAAGFQLTPQVLRKFPDFQLAPIAQLLGGKSLTPYDRAALLTVAKPPSVESVAATPVADESATAAGAAQHSGEGV